MNPYKLIVGFGAILVLVVGVVAGVHLTQRTQIIPAGAWDCSRYVFEISRDGVVTARNGSRLNEPSQRADVYIDGVKVATFDVPRLRSGDAATLGSVEVNSQDGFTWRVDGSRDCDNEGSFQPEPTEAPTETPTETPTDTPTESPTETPTEPPVESPDPSPTTEPIIGRCVEINIYDEEGNLINPSVAQLNTGEQVKFAIKGESNFGDINTARFRVNGGLYMETTEKELEEFVLDYVIPNGITELSVEGQLFHPDLGWF